MGPDATKENILIAERLLWPLKPQTPYLGTRDGSLPTYYQNVLDPLETLTYVAANTNKIASGTCVVDMLFHNPVVLARRFATLDVLSEGRVVCEHAVKRESFKACVVPCNVRNLLLAPIS